MASTYARKLVKLRSHTQLFMGRVPHRPRVKKQPASRTSERFSTTSQPNQIVPNQMLHSQCVVCGEYVFSIFLLPHSIHCYSGGPIADKTCIANNTVCELCGVEGERAHATCNIRPANLCCRLHAQSCVCLASLRVYLAVCRRSHSITKITANSGHITNYRCDCVCTRPSRSHPLNGNIIYTIYFTFHMRSVRTLYCRSTAT